MERYDRQMLLPGFDQAAQRRLGAATAVVAGVGGVGGAAALYLAAAGVGRLVLFHEGPLDLPDLNRQVLMTEDWVGRERVACARDTLSRLNGEVEVVAVAERMSRENLDRWLSEADVALGCRHNFPERYLLNEVCVARRVPLVEAAMDAMEAYLTVIRPGETPCLACLYPEAPPGWNPLGFPVLGAVAGTLGTLAALEAVKVVTGFGRPLAHKLLAMDLGDATFRGYTVRRLEGCPVCGGMGGVRDEGARLAI